MSVGKRWSGKHTAEFPPNNKLWPTNFLLTINQRLDGHCGISFVERNRVRENWPRALFCKIMMFVFSALTMILIRMFFPSSSRFVHMYKPVCVWLWYFVFSFRWKGLGLCRLTVGARQLIIYIVCANVFGLFAKSLTTLQILTYTVWLCVYV